jgi:hypothetical protein
LFYHNSLQLFATQVFEKESSIQELEENFASLLQQSVRQRALWGVRRFFITSHCMR